MAHSSTPTETHTGQPNKYKKTFFHTTLSDLVLSCDEPEQQQRQSVKGSHHRLSKGEKKESCLPVLFLASSIKHIQKSDFLVNHTLLAIGIYYTITKGKNAKSRQYCKEKERR